MTIGSAEVLDTVDDVGSIEVDKCASLVMLNVGLNPVFEGNAPYYVVKADSAADLTRTVAVSAVAYEPLTDVATVNDAD